MGLAVAILLSTIAQAEPVQCTAATATRIALERVAREPRRWLDRCVRLSGIAQYSSLFDSVEGLYLSQRRDPARYSLRGNLRHRIGLYGDLPTSGRLTTWSVIGSVDSCERRSRAARRQEEERNRRSRAAGSDEILIVMLAGYCHYHPGAVLQVSEVQVAPASEFERLVGNQARFQYGNLVPGEPGWHRYADFRRRAEEFRAALSDGNRERLSLLHGRFGAGREELDRLLQEADSPFRELRDDNALPFVILYHSFDYSGRSPEDQRHQDGFICYCREADCDDRWPISTIDTGPRPDHPYACVEVSEDGTGQVFMSANLQPAPLREPASTAFRR